MRASLDGSVAANIKGCQVPRFVAGTRHRTDPETTLLQGGYVVCGHCLRIMNAFRKEQGKPDENYMVYVCVSTPPPGKKHTGAVVLILLNETASRLEELKAKKAGKLPRQTEIDEEKKRIQGFLSWATEAAGKYEKAD